MKFTLLSLGLITLALAGLYACNEATPAGTSSKDSTAAVTNASSPDSGVKRGQYLVTILGCSDCHAPKKMGPHEPEPDENLGLSGHPSGSPLPPVNKEAAKNWVLFSIDQTAVVGPWGVSFAANITSDTSGIGGWSEQQFFKAMKEGKYKGLDGGRTLLPPMPWPAFAHMSEEDLHAIFAYLKSTKPVHNVVPEPLPPVMTAAR